MCFKLPSNIPIEVDTAFLHVYGAVMCQPFSFVCVCVFMCILCKMIITVYYKVDLY